MSMMFEGGPMDGMTAPDPMAEMGGAPEEAPADEGTLFTRLLSDLRALLQLDTVSEQNKLSVSKAETLIQAIKASEEKDEEQAMSGKLSPGIMRKLGSG